MLAHAEMIYMRPDGVVYVAPSVDISAFRQDGIVTLRNYFDPRKIAELEQSFLDLYLMQAKKIADYRGIAQSIETNEPISIVDAAYSMREHQRTRGERLSAVCDLMENADKEALYQVQKLFPYSQEIRSFFDDDFMEMCRELLGTRLALLEGPALFVSASRSKRLLYKWHSEAHYYAGRRRFLNIWFPLFEAKTSMNGAMAVKIGSHKKHYDKPPSYQQGEHHFVQFDVPANFHAEFPEHVCETEPGDVVIFDRNLIHTSRQNETKKYSFAVVARVWTPEDDLNIAGDIRDQIGRADLVVAA